MGYFLEHSIPEEGDDEEYTDEELGIEEPEDREDYGGYEPDPGFLPTSYWEVPEP